MTTTTTKTIKINDLYLNIIKSWKPETLINKFQQLTKISDDTKIKGFKRLSIEAQKDALILFISKQPISKLANINQFVQPEIGTRRMFKDGEYEVVDKGNGKSGYKKVTAL